MTNFHQNKLLKVAATIVLVLSVLVYFYYDKIEAIVLLFILPIHLALIALGIVMLVGISSDQKLIKKEIEARIGGTRIFSRLRNEWLSFACIIIVFTACLFPASGFMESVSQGIEGSTNGYGLAGVQLIFALFFFIYFLVARPVLYLGIRKIANKALKTDAQKTRAS